MTVMAKDARAKRDATALRSCLTAYAEWARRFTVRATKARKGGCMEEAALLEQAAERLWDAHANELLNAPPEGLKS